MIVPVGIDRNCIVKFLAKCFCYFKTVIYTLPKCPLTSLGVFKAATLISIVIGVEFLHGSETSQYWSIA